MLADPPADLHLEVRRASKLFGSTVALWQVDFEAREGEFVLALGANGSGKSTLLRVVAGLTWPTAGQVCWTTGADSARPRIAYVGHAAGLHDELTPLEHLVLASRLTRTDPASGMAVLERLGAAELAGEPCGHLSAGMRRRVALARAFSSGADAILLDEPLAALDDSGVTAVLGLIREATRNGCVAVAASPSDGRLRELADRSIALAEGRVLHAVASSEDEREQIDVR